MSTKSKPLWDTKFKVLLGVIALGVLCAGVYQAGKAAKSAPLPTAAPYDARIESPTVSFDLVLNGPNLVSGPSDITVAKNAAVRVNITAQGQDEVHAELPAFGINTEAHATDNTPGGFSFIADKAGVFPFYAYTEDATGKDTAKHKVGTITVK